MLEIKQHPWFLKNMPREVVENDRKCSKKSEKEEITSQSVDEIMRIVREARIPYSIDADDVDEIEEKVDHSGDCV